MGGLGIALMIFFIMLIILGVSGFIIYKAIKKTDPRGNDQSESPTIKTTQEFLPFEDVRDDVIFLGGHRYRAVLVCSSTNYRLKTAGEKDQIELSFQRFLNTINFPITFFLQTKVIDNSARISQVEKDIGKTIASFPGMSGYAEQYLNDMRSLSQKLGNNQQKKRYIIISYDNAEELSKLTEAEKDDYSVREVRRRAQVVQSNLDAVGVASQLMTTEELIELIYSSYWRDDYSYASEISEGNCFSLFVEGEEDRFKDLPKVELLDVILGETTRKLELADIDSDAAGREVIKQINELRRVYAGGSQEHRR